MSEGYRVGDYLLDRIAEFGVTDVFGVPGDYNLAFMDIIDENPKVNWIGTANELNASYAADAYARARGLSVMVTTYGVGELSAINGTAGSYAEYAPVLHIVGAPRTWLQKEQKVLHHSLGDGQFDHFLNMARHVTIAQAKLTAQNAAAEIDRVIREVVLESRPGYIMLPADVAEAEIYRPAGPLQGIEKTSSPDAVQAFKEAARDHLQGKTVAVLADLIVDRLDATEELHSLLEHTTIPYSTCAWGKSLVDESSPRFAGIYAGAASDERARAAVEDAEVLLKLGVIFNDSITAGFTHEIDPNRVISVDSGVASVGEVMFAPIAMRDSIQTLVELAQESEWKPQPLAPIPNQKTPEVDPDAPLTQEQLWALLAEGCTRGQTVIADQGTSFYGIAPHSLPTNSLFIGQPQWGSIGYTLPATLGAALARPDHRAVLLIGDGSAQLTLQELGTILREGLTPFIVLVNNDGYTVERAIRGPEKKYNDIQPYNWQKVLETFGGTPENCVSLKATTRRELEEALKIATETQDKLVFLEAVTGRLDYPPLLQALANSAK
ncbi:indolepyruvate decarboxylase [Corynebacterium sp. 3HC-13]|uniref:alpha-keto acid decarboxylase family protein n=1 Tax=Corynebacterium poyangense TaxID=2684405 RepID=UPI001CCA78A9|nr:thiamine pyrophosphate-binding protein [Corynebacterium poyangense]MBZ8178393.1 indolepyruvate decarboxylase [Corynebacterium poyangense]